MNSYHANPEVLREVEWDDTVADFAWILDEKVGACRIVCRKVGVWSIPGGLARFGRIVDNDLLYLRRQIYNFRIVRKSEC